MKNTEQLNATIEQMLTVKNSIAEHKFIVKQLEQEEELLNIKLIGVLKQMKTDEIILPNCRFGFKTIERTAFDQKLFSADHPELFEKYRTTKQNEKFEFKIGNYN